MRRLPLSDTRTLFAAGLILGSAVVTFAGWRLMLFTTDDAHIAFRYISNWVSGRGLVWNPPPFAPVEGYTSFGWCILLGAIWKLTGLTPPESSLWVSLGFGYLTLYFGTRLFLRFVPAGRGQNYRLGLLALVALATVTNRTFLTWLSSGLETAMFNCCITWWLFESTTESAKRGPSWILRFSLSTALLTLTRPDGLLFLAFTTVVVALHLKRSRLGLRGLLAVAPLLAPVAHLLWRRSFYGLWLPTTYYAKNAGYWPDAGLHYVLSYVLEYATWFPLACALVFWGKSRLGRRQPSPIPGTLWKRHAEVLAPITLLLVHASYYVLLGGDHFEYRVFSHLPLLTSIAMAWVVSCWSSKLRISGLLMAAFIAFSWPIGWAHWYNTRNLSEYSTRIVSPIAPLFPVGLRSVVQWWDREQAWLIAHMIGCRQIEHKLFFDHQVGLLPTRAEGSKVSWENGHPVKVSPTVGLIGWVVPNIGILDNLGLNDRVISRAKPRRDLGAIREMAHERVAPMGYIDCFQPNVWFEDRRTYVLPRRKPLTDQQIVDCERHDWSRVEPNLSYESVRRQQRQFEFDSWMRAVRDSAAATPRTVP